MPEYHKTQFLLPPEYKLLEGHAGRPRRVQAVQEGSINMCWIEQTLRQYVLWM